LLRVRRQRPGKLTGFARAGPGAAIALWYLPLHARGLDEVIEGEQLAPINDLM